MTTKEETLEAGIIIGNKSEEINKVLKPEQAEFIRTHLKNGEDVIRYTDTAEICDELHFYTLDCFDENHEIDDNGLRAETIIDYIVYGYDWWPVILKRREEWKKKHGE